jgi:hypothetical protein
MYFRGANEASAFATQYAITSDTNGGNGYVYNQNNTPTGYRGGGNSTNVESVSAISLGGSKFLVQYAEFNGLGTGGPTKQTLQVFDYSDNNPGTAGIQPSTTELASLQANTNDNGWQIGARSFALKEGGFVSLWASNQSSAGSATAGGTMDGFDVYSRRFSYNGSNKLTALDTVETRVNTTTNGVNGVGFDTMSTGHFSGVGLAHGGYVVVWQKFTSAGASETYSQGFDAAGNKLGSETLVSTNFVDSTGTVTTLPWVAALKDGGYVVSWTSENTTDYAMNSLTGDIKMVIVNADGSVRAAGQTPAITASYLGSAGTLTGDAAVNTLDGRNGATVMDAQGGNDYLIIQDTAFTSVDGGLGRDTLVWSSSSSLNFSAIAAKVSNIEVIHLGDSGTNQLTLSLSDVLGASSTTDQLLVQGGAGDTVDLDLAKWSTAATQTYKGESYAVYSHADNAAASLWVHATLSVI